MSKSLQDFFLMVERMRALQKDYFKIRSRPALVLAKEWEARVDAFIKQKRIEEAQQKQPELILGGSTWQD